VVNDSALWFHDSSHTIWVPAYAPVVGCLSHVSCHPRSLPKHRASTDDYSNHTSHKGLDRSTLCRMTDI
jgi:hypothetical protein